MGTVRRMLALVLPQHTCWFCGVNEALGNVKRDGEWRPCCGDCWKDM